MYPHSRFDRSPRNWAFGFAGLLVLAGCTALVAGLGSWATTRSVDSDWFASLDKPEFYPPDATFGIVWTILYVLIALSAWLALRAGGGRDVLVPWTIQLALNLCWTLAFFGVRSPRLGMVVIVALIATAIWTAWAMWPHSRVAMLMFVPYILWAVFAAVLNWSIVALN